VVSTLPTRRPAGTSADTRTKAGTPGGTGLRLGEAACTDLAKVSGQIALIPRLPGYYCLSLYDPVTASANGVWNGRPIYYSRTFTNSCEADIGTGGHVFHF
jgi:subtilisin inhibitor-like